MSLWAIAGASVQAVSEVFLVASFGAYIAYRGVLPKTSIKALDKLIVELFTPCLILGKVIPQADPADLLSFWPLMLVCCWNLSIGLVFGWLLSIALRKPKLRGVLQAAVAFPNSISVVLTLMQALSRTDSVLELVRVNPDGLDFASFTNSTPDSDAASMRDLLHSRASVIVLTSTVWWNLARWTVAYNLLAPGSASLRDRVLKIFNPPVIACVVAFVFGMIDPLQSWWSSDHPTAVVIVAAVDMMGRCMVPVVLVVLGARVMHVHLDKREQRRDAEAHIELTNVEELEEECLSVERINDVEDPSDENDFTATVSFSILIVRQVLCLLLGLAFTWLFTKVTHDISMLLVMFLQTAGPPMINLTVLAGLHGSHENALAYTLMLCYLSSSISWTVGIFLCLQMLHLTLM